MKEGTTAVAGLQTVAVDNTHRVRRILQCVMDHVTLTGRNLSELRILDLGCAHGQYALELARRGASVVGVEGRQNWVDHANLSRSQSGLKNVSFIQGDVRALSKARYGDFNIVLCLGLLYHLDFPDCLEMLDKISEVCTSFAVIDTQIATTQSPQNEHSWRGKTYKGWKYREHLSGATASQKEATMGASLDDEFSFWLTRSSLLNGLRQVGFTSVYECLNPLDCMYAGEVIKLHADVLTTLAIKGQSVGPFFGMSPERSEEDDWPENPQGHYLIRPWT